MRRYELITAGAATHRSELIELNVEYLTWVFAGIEELFAVPADAVAGMPVREYVPRVIDKVCGDPPPKGVFYLVTVDGSLAGMGGLRFLHPDTAEIKRIYFRPEFRGLKLGELLLHRLLDDAKTFGYKRVVLDTAVFMRVAQRLYEKNGFTDCPAYQGVEVPADFHGKWRFMERQL